MLCGVLCGVLLLAALLAAQICLFALGAIKTRFSVMEWWKGGLEILVMGSGCAGAAYLIGWFVNAIVLGGEVQAGHR